MEFHFGIHLREHIRVVGPSPHSQPRLVTTRLKESWNSEDLWNRDRNCGLWHLPYDVIGTFSLSFIFHSFLAYSVFCLVGWYQIEHFIISYFSFFLFFFFKRNEENHTFRKRNKYMKILILCESRLFGAFSTYIKLYSIRTPNDDETPTLAHFASHLVCSPVFNRTDCLPIEKEIRRFAIPE